QEVLEGALQTITRREVQTVGAARTDTGVHAKQLFVHLDFSEAVPDPGKFLHQLNALLPKDIAAKSLMPVRSDAHARFDAIRRSYEYHMHFYKDPFKRGYSWQVRDVPDVNSMNEAAA